MSVASSPDGDLTTYQVLVNLNPDLDAGDCNLLGVGALPGADNLIFESDAPLEAGSWLTIGNSANEWEALAQTAYSPGLFDGLSCCNLEGVSSLLATGDAGYYANTGGAYVVDDGSGIMVAQFTLPSGVGFSYSGSVGYSTGYFSLSHEVFAVSGGEDDNDAGTEMRTEVTLALIALHCVP